MKTTQFKTETMDITPAWAKARLDELEKQLASGEFKQRPVRERAVQRYAQDMKAGKWKLTHQGIAFDSNGHLIDGQNRLWAVVRSGATVRMNVTEGIPVEDKPIDVIDLGSPRTVWQALQLSYGYDYTAIELQALVRGVSIMVLHSPTHPPVGLKHRSVQISVAEALFILEEIGFKADFERLVQLCPNKRFRYASMAAPWCIYHRRNPKKADRFAQAYSTLEEQQKGSPALALFRYFSDPASKPRKEIQKKVKVTANALAAWDQGIDVGAAGLRMSNEAFSWLMRLNPEENLRIYKRLLA